MWSHQLDCQSSAVERSVFEINISACHLGGRGFDFHSLCHREGDSLRHWQCRFPPGAPVSSYIHYKWPNLFNRANNIIVDAQLSIQCFCIFCHIVATSQIPINWWGRIFLCGRFFSLFMIPYMRFPGISGHNLTMLIRHKTSFRSGLSYRSSSSSEWQKWYGTPASRIRTNEIKAHQNIVNER
jgi:hypothetical protein